MHKNPKTKNQKLKCMCTYQLKYDIWIQVNLIQKKWQKTDQLQKMV